MSSLHRTSRLSLGALAVAFLISACGGGGGGEAPAPAPGGTELSIRTATPASGATDVATDTRPRLLFSHGLDASTATAGNIRLFSAQGDENFATNVAGAELLVQPQRRLLPLT
ncbi:MAG TPA: Ig-like domain-containing protein, partial [Ramlibacter sp.]|nr:Ig-like domain-containing protein [Ramlibacter sp.]